MCVCVFVVILPASKVELSHTHLTAELEEIQSLQQKAVRSSQLRRDIREVDQKIAAESSKLAGADSSRTQVTVNRELQEAQMKMYVSIP